MLLAAAIRRGTSVNVADLNAFAGYAQQCEPFIKIVR
jgi:hypothetical protein